MDIETKVLTGVRLSDDEVLRAARLTDGEEEDQARALELRDEICTVGRPKYLLVRAEITDRGADWVELGGVRFRSPALARELGGLTLAYPYLATCGAEAADWASALGSELEQYWARELMLLLLGRALNGLNARLAELMPAGRVARLAPGTVPDWTLYGQRDLFRLFGAETIGVTLLDSCLMTPENTVSGCAYPARE